MKVMETNGQLQGKYLQILFTDRFRHLHLKGTIITNQIVKLLAQKARVRLVIGSEIICIYKSIVHFSFLFTMMNHNGES